MNTIQLLDGLINNFQSYRKELELGNISEHFCRERISELCADGKLRFSNSEISKRELRRREKDNMEAMEKTISKLKGEALAEILPVIDLLGYRGFSKKTGLSSVTISELKNQGQNMKLERLLDIQRKVS
jgi:hypothetical protein